LNTSRHNHTRTLQHILIMLPTPPPVCGYQGPPDLARHQLSVIEAPFNAWIFGHDTPPKVRLHILFCKEPLHLRLGAGRSCTGDRSASRWGGRGSGACSLTSVACVEAICWNVNMRVVRVQRSQGRGKLGERPAIATRVMLQHFVVQALSLPSLNVRKQNLDTFQPH